MRIAFITLMAGFPWGGSELLWTTTAKEALLDGHEVVISVFDWSLNHPKILELQQQGAEVISRPRFPEKSALSQKSFWGRVVKKSGKYFRPSPLSIDQLCYQTVLDKKPDFIYINQGNTYDIVYAIDLLNLLRLASTPYGLICQFNSDTYSLEKTTKQTARDVFEKATFIAFVSQQNLKLAERQLAYSLPNAVVVQNPVNIQNLDTLPYPVLSQPCFAVVARLDIEFKGQDVLFESFSLPFWQDRNWQCKLYGSGPDKEYLESLAAYYGISDKVKFVGHVANIQSVWSENHILILPSRGEGTPLSLIEAMLCGRPAIVTDVGDNANWIEESKTGFVAEASSVRSIAAALDRSWLAQDRWERMGVQAHQIAFSRLDRRPGRSLLKLFLETR